MKRISLFITALAITLYCTKDTVINRTPPFRATATIYEPYGVRPAVKASVTLFEAGAIGDNPIAACTTDSLGRFSIEALPAGICNVWAEKDSFVLFQDSVLVSSTFSTIHDDTLEPPSSLSGLIGIQPLHDPHTVSVQILGSGKSANCIDTACRFQLTELAGGTVTLLFTSTLPGYIPTKKTITIAAGSNGMLSDTFRLAYTGIPVVSGIRIVQDTFGGTVKLFWGKTPYRQLQDYVLFKKSCSDSGPLPRAPFQATADTFFIDSSYCRAPADPRDTAIQCLAYAVVVRSNSQEIGPSCDYATIPFAPKSWVSTFFSHAVRNANSEGDSASIHDTVVIAMEAINKTRLLRFLFWYDPTANDTIPVMPVHDTAERRIEDTIRYSFGSVGTGRVISVVEDNAGVKWSDTIPVKIVQDAPAAEAGHDTGVFAGDTVHLHGRATQRFGDIAVWKWKIISGEWVAAPGPDIAFVAPMFETPFVCSLAVTDDDGNLDTDEIKIFPSLKACGISASCEQSFVLKSDNTLWACGSNDFGQLGDGTRSSRSSLVRIMADVRSVDAGYLHSLFLKIDGTLWACGNNAYGQLGDSSTSQHSTPVQIMTDVLDMGAGNYHSLILKTDGTLWACGFNNFGQLGDSTSIDRINPVPVMANVQRMGAGHNFSLILKTDGTLWACGMNDCGQLGDGAWINRLAPVRVMSDVKDLAAGYGHSLILKTDGTLWACGFNNFGQLGDGTTANWPTPVRVMADVKNIAASNYHSLLLKTDGTLWACGKNDHGQLGDGTVEQRHRPVCVAGGVQSISAGESCSLILKTDGTLWVCGQNNAGQRGDGLKEDRLTPARAIPILPSSSVGGGP